MAKPAGLCRLSVENLTNFCRECNFLVFGRIANFVGTGLIPDNRTNSHDVSLKIRRNIHRERKAYGAFVNIYYAVGKLELKVLAAWKRHAADANSSAADANRCWNSILAVWAVGIYVQPARNAQNNRTFCEDGGSVHTLTVYVKRVKKSRRAELSSTLVWVFLGAWCCDVIVG